MLARALPSLDVPASAPRRLHLKPRQRTFHEATYVESYLSPNRLGANVWKISTGCGRTGRWPGCRGAGDRVRWRQSTPQRIAALIASFKRDVKPTCKGDKGYQPLPALWAEMDLAMADEFRDGNVPAHVAALATGKRAFAALPERVTEYYFRADSAWWQHDLVQWQWARPKRLRFPFFFSPGKLI